MQQEWLVEYGGLRFTLRITLWIVYFILFTSLWFAESSLDVFIHNLASVWYFPVITFSFYLYGLYRLLCSYPVCFNSKTGLVSFFYRGELLQQSWENLEAVLKAGVMKNNRSFLAINFYLLDKKNKRLEVRILGSSQVDGKLDYQSLDWNKPGRHLWAFLCRFMDGKEINTPVIPAVQTRSTWLKQFARGIFIFPEAFFNDRMVQYLKERPFPVNLQTAIDSKS